MTGFKHTLSAASCAISNKSLTLWEGLPERNLEGRHSICASRSHLCFQIRFAHFWKPFAKARQCIDATLAVTSSIPAPEVILLMMSNILLYLTISFLDLSCTCFRDDGCARPFEAATCLRCEFASVPDRASEACGLKSRNSWDQHGSGFCVTLRSDLYYSCSLGEQTLFYCVPNIPMPLMISYAYRQYRQNCWQKCQHCTALMTGKDRDVPALIAASLEKLPFFLHNYHNSPNREHPVLLQRTHEKQLVSGQEDAVQPQDQTLGGRESNESRHLKKTKWLA